MNLLQLNVQPFIGTITLLRNENLNKCDHTGKMSTTGKSLNGENQNIQSKKNIVQNDKVFKKHDRPIQSRAKLTVFIDSELILKGIFF